MIIRAVVEKTANVCVCVCVCPLTIEVSGEIQMDFKADRISDFVVYYLSENTGKYEEYMHIPLTHASTNITDCMPWMVCCFRSSHFLCHLYLLASMTFL